MELQAAYITLKKHLQAKYKNSGSELGMLDYQNLVSARAIMLARLYLGIRRYSEENAKFNPSPRETIIHLLHAEAELTLRDLDQLPASLALKLLDRHLSSLEVSFSPDFQKAEKGLGEWLDENREWIAQSHEAGAALPELQWSDLPSELFRGLTGTRSS
ncbi:hypothetical protein J8631_01410 [Serratia fonticola]|uniref:hypothetical protein n=1 Tax=Serratia fonticola TaxID=47917 RepID=UPI001AE9BBC3|nr:hypothetical protein [Serratia fonticola]MBP1034209.1 hypothetical protein [Serratia fonticola]